VTCLDPTFIKTLALPFHTPTLANMPAGSGIAWTSLYQAGVTILHPSGHPRQHHVRAFLLVCELPLGLLGYHAVIGRDIRNRLRFPYRSFAATKEEKASGAEPLPDGFTRASMLRRAPCPP